MCGSLECWGGWQGLGGICFGTYLASGELQEMPGHSRNTVCQGVTGLPFLVLPPCRLDSNQLQGNLTGGAWLPSRLQLLSLHHNQLAGPLPQDLQLPPTLKQLSLHFNQFTGWAETACLQLYLHCS